MSAIRFRLNGVETAVDADPDRPLLDVLRGELGLTGPHFGCGAGECGACHVLLGDRAVTSCDTPLWSAADQDITTVEGLGNAERPHPLQRAFISAAALLRQNPTPTDADVRAALDRNLCRCGSHNRMIRAVLRAASEMAAS
jgi:nicotinate dehydrogenase subunit A